MQGVLLLQPSRKIMLEEAKALQRLRAPVASDPAESLHWCAHSGVTRSGGKGRSLSLPSSHPAMAAVTTLNTWKIPTCPITWQRSRYTIDTELMFIDIKLKSTSLFLLIQLSGRTGLICLNIHTCLLRIYMQISQVYGIFQPSEI